MKRLNDLPLICKLSIPLVLLLALSIGLVTLAKSSLDHLTSEMHQLTDVNFARTEALLQLQSALKEGQILQLNVILQTDEEQLKVLQTRFDAAKANVFLWMDRLTALSDTEQRRTINVEFKKATPPTWRSRSASSNSA